MTKRARLGASKDNKKLANKREVAQAKELGGSRVPLSGALNHAKGDIKVKDWLLDSKYTCKISINISGTQLAKINKEAREAGKKPALLIKLESPPFGTPGSWVVMPQIDFEELINDR